MIRKLWGGRNAEADTLKTWQTIYDSFLRYRQCDDGAIAEGYSFSVVTTLADRWEQLPSLDDLIAHDGSFRDFVFSHIDATMPTEELATIARHAERKCPSELAKLCAEIRQKALDAEAQEWSERASSVRATTARWFPLDRRLR